MGEKNVRKSKHFAFKCIRVHPQPAAEHKIDVYCLEMCSKHYPTIIIIAVCYCTAINWCVISMYISVYLNDPNIIKSFCCVCFPLRKINRHFREQARNIHIYEELKKKSECI